MKRLTPTKPLSFPEFVGLMALMIALTAMSIDIVLPALPDIGSDLAVARANDSQLILSWFFTGLAIGQLIYGPVSDSIGRRPPIYVGLGLFILGCIGSIFATSFPMMLAARLLQGLGAAGPRSIAVAIVRDQYAGNMMARVMSFIMAFFILVPIIAPSIGQGILFIGSWRAIFGFVIGLAIIIMLWFGLRQPETLPAEKQIPFTFTRIFSAVREVLRNRISLGFTLAAGLISGAFLGYLNSAQPIFQEQYGLGARFPLVFAGIAVASATAYFLNARLVLKYGMWKLTNTANIGLATASILFFGFAYTHAGDPPLWTLIGYCLVILFSVGILFGNLNALAMEPLGHIAGVGAAIVGSLSSFISIPIGAYIGLSFNHTVLPLAGGFATMCFVAIFVMQWAKRRGQLQPALA